MSKKNVEWEWKKLGDVCEIARGGSPRPIKEFITTEKDGINWIKIGDTDPMGKYILETKEKIKPAGLKSSRYVEPGDLLLSNSMSFGRPYIMKTSGCIHDGWLVLKNYHHFLNTDFFYHLLLSPIAQDQFDNEAKGSTVRNLNTDIVSKISVPIPPLDEQERIVKVLDDAFEKIDAIKTTAETNLQNAKDLFQTTLAQELTITDEKIKQGWEEKYIGDVLETSSGGTPLKSHKDYYENGTIPWLRSGEVCQKEINETEMFITEKGLANSSAKLFPKNTVAVAMYGATAGQVGILRFKTTTNQAVCGILPRKEFLPEFIYYVLLNKKEELVAQAVGGAQPNISQIKIRCTSIPILTIDDQKQIVAKLDSLSEKVKQLESNYKQVLADCDELKKSILKKAFNGEL